MKNLFLLSVIVLLSACAQPESDTSTMPPASMPEEAMVLETKEGEANLSSEGLLEAPIGSELSNENGLVLTLDSLSERQRINAPLLVGGTVRRDWVHEASFPITLMTLTEDVVAEGYGTASWLEPLEGDTLETMSGEDMIPFVASVDFEAPAEEYMGKIRFGNSVIAEDDVEQYVELMILWP